MTLEESGAVFDDTRIQPLIANVVQLMETKCIRLSGDRVDWRALFAQHARDINRCRSAEALEESINRILSQGGLSHVAFFHETAERAPARYAINATFCALHSGEPPQWMFQDVHEGGPAYVAGVRPGHVLVAVEHRPVQPPAPPTFSLGKDTVVTVEDCRGNTRQVPITLPKAEPRRDGKGKPPMAEPTSVTVRAIRDDLGYVRVAFFPGVSGQRFARELHQALAKLAKCTRLIVDLRGNLGGFVGHLRLMSYLTPKRLPVGYSLTRLGEDRRLRPERLPCIDSLPESRFNELKMVFRFKVLHRDRSVRLVTEGLGPQPFHSRIVMLINEHTASAGEVVAAFAAENKLATLVGTRTAGEVLGGANFPVGDGFILRLPAAGWYTWRHSVVEGRGVSPDIDVPLSIDGLRQGEDNQLAKAVESATGM